MASSVDVFTLPLFGHKPTLDDLLLALPANTAEALIGRVVETPEQAKAYTDGLHDDEHEALLEQTRLILHGGRIDPEDLIALAKQNGATEDLSHTGGHMIALLLIQKLGNATARVVFEKQLGPTALDRAGTFTYYEGPPLKFDKLDTAKIEGLIEDGLESQLSRGKKLQVIVRAQLYNRTLLASVYYDRPAREGRKISREKGKRLTTEPFARGAASTFFVVRPHGVGTRVMFRVDRIQDSLLPTVAHALWGTSSALGFKPSATYNLDVLKDPNFQFRIAPEHLINIESIQLVDLTAKAATGNLINVHAHLSKDALEDFHRIAEGAQVLVKGSEIKKAVVRFRSAIDKRRKPRVRITETTLQLDEEHLEMVEDHLRLWGIAVQPVRVESTPLSDAPLPSDPGE